MAVAFCAFLTFYTVFASVAPDIHTWEGGVGGGDLMMFLC